MNVSLETTLVMRVKIVTIRRMGTNVGACLALKERKTSVLVGT